MTLEELDIVVEANIEPALKEIRKLMPNIRKEIKGAQSEINGLNFNNISSKMNMSGVKKQVGSAVKEVKKVTDEMNEYLGKNFTINGIKPTMFRKNISGISNEFKKMSSDTNTLDKILDLQYYKDKLNQAENATKNTKSKIDNIIRKGEWAGPTVDPNKFMNESTAMPKSIDSNKPKEENITFWDRLKKAIKGVIPSIQQVKQNMNSISPNKLSNISGIAVKVKNQFKQMGTGIKQGIGHVIKYAGALFGLRSIYNVLRNSANSWLSSQNSGAQQLSANIEYMKYAMGSVFAPVIEFVINLVYKLMKALQSIVYMFSGINIFAKATASSMKSAAGSAGKASKSLAGVHNEINNVSSSDSGGGSGSVAPDIDLSNMDDSMNNWISGIKDKLAVLFEPIKKSWEAYGQPLIESIKFAFGSNIELIKSMGQSLVEVWTNGTGETTLNFILQTLTSIFNIIGNIHTAFTEAWNNNGGTEIIQNLWNGFNNLLEIIHGVFQAFEEWTASESFQTFANSIVGICKTLSGWFEKITAKLKEIWNNGGQQTFTKLLEFISKLANGISEFMTFMSPVIDFAVELIGGAVETIVKVLGDVLDALGGLIDFIVGVFTGDWDKAWEGIKTFFGGIWQGILDLVTGLGEQIWAYIESILKGIGESWDKSWQWISDFASNIWNGLLDMIDNIFPGMKDIIVTIVDNIKNTISNVLNTISGIWNNIWNGISSTVSSVWNGIWNTIRNVINSILGGIEGMVNGVVRGINKMVSAINSLRFNIPDWVPGLGGKSFGINLPYASEVSLPRLNTGNVAYKETLAVFGEYQNAASNPEITAPQSTIYDTTRRAFEDALFNGSGLNNDRPINITLNVGNTKLGQILLNDLREMKRRTGKDFEVLVGG